MPNRITTVMLEQLIYQVNQVTRSPDEPYTNGKANIGNYHLSRAYGGVCLHRMFNEGGGVSAPLTASHVSKRELYNALRAYLLGIDTGIRITTSKEKAA